jgi:transposase
MILITDKRIEELAQINRIQAEENLQLKAKIAWFEEQFKLARHRQFGASSEQTLTGQEALLFNEAEAIALPDIPEPSVETITYDRRKPRGGRQAQVAGLPVEEIPYRLPEDEQVCPQCAGPLHEMGADVRQEIKIVPATVTLVLHQRFKYGCRHCQCEETTTPIVTAQAPKPAFPNGIASASAVAHIMTEKFVMGSPLYRQEQQLKRNEINLSRQTMANWMIKGAEWLDFVYGRLHVELLACDDLHADETPLQVLREPGRKATTDSYMWLYRTGSLEPPYTQTDEKPPQPSARSGPIVLFDYQMTRAGKHPKDFLQKYERYLHVDAYDAYDPLSPQMILVGCWAHARRKFDEAVKVLPPAARKDAGHPSPAHIGLKYCNDLYKIEKIFKDSTAAERYEGRLEYSKPLLDSFKKWLDEQALKVIPKCALATAINYCRNQWSKLCAFLLDGRLEIDNNRAERSIKGFVIGRKNFLFANTPNGARSSAIIYSIVETAKENGLNPFKYLEYLFEKLPNIDRDDPAAIAGLLPWAEAVQEKCGVPARK